MPLVKNIIPKGFKAKEFIIVVLLSGLIGDLVASPFIILGRERIQFLLASSFGVGMGIAIISLIVFSIFYKNIRKNTVLAFSSIVVTIAAGTFAGAFLLGERNILNMLIMISLAECVGLLLAAIVYKKTEKLNKQLEIAQKKFDRDS